MRVRLQLFVAGDSSRSVQAARNVRALCDELYPDDYDLDVIDVIERPDLADEARVLATPSIIKVFPPPSRHAIGDLSDLVRLRAALDLHPTPPQSSHERSDT